MPQPTPPLDNPLLMTPATTVLVVVDMQEKLLPAIDQSAAVVWNTRRLLDGASILDVPVLGTEQYPQGLGPTVSSLAEKLGPLPAKVVFSGCEAIEEALQHLQRPKVLLAGIEAHVCVQQTALDLLSLGYDVYLAVDAIGSRFPLDKDVAIRRMDSSGVNLTTTEATLFEWCRVAGTPQFKQISQLVRESAP